MLMRQNSNNASPGPPRASANASNTRLTATGSCMSNVPRVSLIGCRKSGNSSCGLTLVRLAGLASHSLKVIDAAALPMPAMSVCQRSCQGCNAWPFHALKPVWPSKGVRVFASVSKSVVQVDGGEALNRSHAASIAASCSGEYSGPASGAGSSRSVAAGWRGWRFRLGGS
jgi:hypothetical protein